MSRICSPYLKLLSDKGIQWNYSLTPDMVTQAKGEDKLIFLHIGYISNMRVREESVKLFSNAEVIDILNTNFICIAEDKDDNPESYLVALDILMMNNDFSQGPINIFLMPDRRPILYSSETDPKQFMNIVNNILSAKNNRRELLNTLANDLTHRTKQSGIITAVEDNRDNLNSAKKSLDSYVFNWYNHLRSDNPTSLLTIMEYVKHYKSTEIEDELHNILDTLQLSPLFDPIDGGFFKQNNENGEKTISPEKNLEENALYMHLYALGWEYYKTDSFKETTLLIRSFMYRELFVKRGGYLSNTTIRGDIKDALYYTYSINELKILFPSRYQEISVALGIDTRLNNDEKQRAIRQPDTYTLVNSTELAQLRGRRKEHIGYFKDTRIISSYNSLMVTTLAKIASIFNDPDYLQESRSLFDYLLNNNINSRGRLLRYTCCSDGCRFGFLSDYGQFIEASLELYSATKIDEYKKIALNYLDFVIDNFYKAENGMFSKSEKMAEVPIIPIKRESNIDLLKPSANSIIAGVLVKAFIISGNNRYINIAEQQFANVIPSIDRSGDLLSGWAYRLTHYLNLPKK